MFAKRATSTESSQIPPFPTELRRQAFHTFFKADGVYWFYMTSERTNDHQDCYCLYAKRDSSGRGTYTFEFYRRINGTKYTKTFYGETVTGQYHTLLLKKSLDVDARDDGKPAALSAEGTLSVAYITHSGTAGHCGVIYVVEKTEEQTVGWCGWLTKEIPSDDRSDCNQPFTECVEYVKGFPTPIYADGCTDTCKRDQ